MPSEPPTSSGSAQRELPVVEKCPTGIRGFDQITGGGLPRGRPTLVCGGPGCGKTVFAIEFIVRGALEHGEHGVFVSFEEREQDLVHNVGSMGFDLEDLRHSGLVAIDHVRIERSEIEEAGEYDLEGLFVRLGHAIASVGATRVALDTLESLFSGFTDPTILRAELRRLFTWLKERGVTAVVTGERGDGGLTRQGLEEFVTDCVVMLDHRVREQTSTRRLRVVKFRGSVHGTNEYPFLIGEHGISVFPITSVGLDHTVSGERITSGVEGLDAMLGGAGFYRGSSVLVSGTAGTGKSTLAAHFAAAVCRAGERSLFFAFEESQGQILRNMASVGVDLSSFVEDGRLRIHAVRPTAHSLERHLLDMHRLAEEHRPAAVVVDPITSLLATAQAPDIEILVMLLLDHLKAAGITALCTSLTGGGGEPEATEVGVSSLMDTWIVLRDYRLAGERRRGVNVVKSRGMAHSGRIREFTLGTRGMVVLEDLPGEARGSAAAGAAPWRERKVHP